eukprot:jgi/Tetstr1/424199/TSEL_014805.t1
MAQLLDLDDRCLLQILKNLTPLPDLFYVALANKRMRSLATGRRLFLYVAPEAGGAADSPGAAAATPSRLPAFPGDGQQFASLSDAVAASRPGDTVLLRPGTHAVPRPVRVPWPLQFLGDGPDAEDTRLVSPRSADATFDFWASGKLRNLTVAAQQGPCVLHQRAVLAVVQCELQCAADRGLEHLVCPLVTVARGAAPAPPPSAGPPAARSQPGAGRLSVEETRILTKGQAVHCAGTGSLQGVRVIYQQRAPQFWFHVDSAQPGSGKRGGIALAAAGSSGAHGCRGEAPCDAMGRNHAGKRPLPVAVGVAVGGCEAGEGGRARGA